MRLLCRIIIFTQFILSVSLANSANFRLASYNVKIISDDPGTAANEYQSLVFVLGRIQPDILCLVEVEGDEDLIQLDQMKTDLTQQYGLTYSYSCTSNVSGPFNPTDLRSACLSRFRIDYFTSWSAAEISTDSQANEVTREFLEVHVDVGGTILGLFVVHLKSASTSADRFRRAVELIRLRQIIQRFKNQNPGKPIAIVGDYNEDLVEGAPFGDVFNSIPAAVPGSYHLGNDISFPIVYNPFYDLQSVSLEYANPTHEDTPGDYSTYVNLTYLTYRRYDYCFFSPQSLNVRSSIVYDACDDNGVDDPPPGQFITLSGSSLIGTCNQPNQTSISTTVSDHFPIVLNLTTDVSPVPAARTGALLVIMATFSLMIGWRKRSHTSK